MGFKWGVCLLWGIVVVLWELVVMFFVPVATLDWGI